VHKVEVLGVHRRENRNSNGKGPPPEGAESCCRQTIQMKAVHHDDSMGRKANLQMRICKLSLNVTGKFRAFREVAGLKGLYGATKKRK